MTDIKDYGYDYELELGDNEEYIPARVMTAHRELYGIVCQYGEGGAKLKGSFYNKLETSANFPAVGDFVLIKYNEHGCSLITKTLDRKSKFSRTDFSGHKFGYAKTILEQVVAANFDYVFIMASLNKDFSIKRIQRYLSAAWESGGTPVIILTKADLVENFSIQVQEIEKIAGDVCIVVVSARTGHGLEQLSEYLKPGKTIVFLGSSGVGKSTLVNALAGEEIMKVSEIREDDSKGRHTTTYRQLIMLKNGVMIIDTPGMRELGMWDVQYGISETFNDIEELSSQCKFSDCTHTNEPKCAIRSAIESGQLEQSRWQTYLQLKQESVYNNSRSGGTRKHKKKQ